MRIDRTLIAVRERTAADIFDLALLLGTRHAFPLLGWSLLGILPFALLNTLALWGEYTWMDERESGPVLAVFLSGFLIYLEAPLATSAATVYLARIMFREPVTWRTIISPVVNMTWQLLWYQCLWRGIAPALVLLAAITQERDADAATGFVFLLGVIPVLLRFMYPYLNEIILLERNPWWPRGKSLSTARRCGGLHRGASAWFSNISGGSVLICAFACPALWYGISFGLSIVGGRIEHSNYYVLCLSNLVMWLLALYVAVVRFLGYLDLRIRREGWEVELILRGAAAHLREGRKAA